MVMCPFTGMSGGAAVPGQSSVTTEKHRGLLVGAMGSRSPRMTRATLCLCRGKAALAAARRFHAGFERELRKELGDPAVRKLRQVLEPIAERGAEHTVAHARLRPL
jgi:hypothetical protein